MKKCDYCGLQNELTALHCLGCGQPLVPEDQLPQTKTKKKSTAAAVILVLIFGPIGLLYLGLEGLLAIIFAVGTSVFLLPLIFTILKLHLALLFNILVRVACAAWAIKVVERRNSNSDDPPEALTLLNEAAKLENIDFAQAIAAYQEVVDQFPNTSASDEAKRNIQTLKSHRG